MAVGVDVEALHLDRLVRDIADLEDGVDGDVGIVVGGILRSLDDVRRHRARKDQDRRGSIRGDIGSGR